MHFFIDGVKPLVCLANRAAQHLKVWHNAVCATLHVKVHFGKELCTVFA